MGRDHYRGGGTLLGFGSASKRRVKKGGVSGVDPSVTAKRIAVQKKKKKQIAANMKKTERIVKALSDQWLAEKSLKAYNKVVSVTRARTSPLAAALSKALEKSGDK